MRPRRCLQASTVNPDKLDGLVAPPLRRLHQPEPRTERFLVVLHPELHHVRPVVNVAHVPVHARDQR